MFVLPGTVSNTASYQLRQEVRHVLQTTLQDYARLVLDV